MQLNDLGLLKKQPIKMNMKYSLYEEIHEKTYSLGKKKLKTNISVCLAMVEVLSPIIVMDGDVVNKAIDKQLESLFNPLFAEVFWRYVGERVLIVSEQTMNGYEMKLDEYSLIVNDIEYNSIDIEALFKSAKLLMQRIEAKG